MYTIGEFAAFGRISPRMLRHYDAIGLLTPAHTDDQTGRRQYAARQLPDLYRIATLRDLGIGLPAIGHVLASDDPERSLRAVLRERRAELVASLDADAARLQRLDRQLSETGRKSTDAVEYSASEAVTVYATEAMAVGGGSEAIGEVIGDLIPRLDDALEAAGRPLIEPGIFWYVPREESDDIDVHISYTAEPVPVPGNGYEVVRLPAAPMMARLRHRGDMTSIHESWGALMTRIVADGYSMIGPCREVYLEAPGHVPGDGWVTELQVPIELTPAS
ncbi:MerR family transcriptional regulator [Microbacterium sp. A8/3-1]|uniref:MerR family transcriptional regulator n=1 Tax=Microbacterium sp. A8/3-1 TaxID=3160749 RepID=A0AAU7VUK3_9MICO